MTGYAAPARRLFLPVRRRLMALACAYLAGIYATNWAVLPPVLMGIFCAFFGVWAVVRLMRRKSALFCIVVCFLLLGNLRAGQALLVRDMPSNPGVQIHGTVCAIEKTNRVYLEDVSIDGKKDACRRLVLVTLMAERDEQGNVITAVPEVCVGQRVSGTGRLFAPEEKRNTGSINRRISVLCDGYELSGYILPGWTAEGEPVFSLKEWFRNLRGSLTAHIGRLYGEQAAVFAGVMLGDKSSVDDELLAAMRLTGTVHVLTVSGMHLSIMGYMLSRFLRGLPLHRYFRITVFGCMLSAFVMLTGGAAGTVRALIMVLLREWAQLRGRRYEPLTGLSAAAILMAFVNPIWPLDASFQFSFFVVLGILLLAPFFAHRDGQRSRWPARFRRAMGMLGVSASAQIASIPMQLMLYGYVPLLSLPMNLLCGWLMPIILLGGWINAAIGALWMDAGAFLGSWLSRVVHGFSMFSEWAAGLNGSILRFPAPYGFSVFLFAALMMLLSPRMRFGRLRVRSAAALSLLIAALYLPRISLAPRYVQLDVGQGDAALFRRGRHAVLIDVGPADSYDALHYLRHEGLFVDAVMLSHLDEDHAGALSVLLDSEVEIPEVILPEGTRGSGLLDGSARGTGISTVVSDALARLPDEGITVSTMAAGDRRTIGSLDVDVLSPPRGRTDEGENEGSLLLFARCEDVGFLLAGDLPIQSEPDDVPDCDVLKAAHHGSKNATSSQFLSMAKPEVTIISAGTGNSYGHPHERVVHDLQNAGSEILRTDEQGCITLWLRDGSWRAETYLAH